MMLTYIENKLVPINRIDINLIKIISILPILIPPFKKDKKYLVLNKTHKQKNAINKLYVITNIESLYIMKLKIILQ